MIIKTLKQRITLYGDAAEHRVFITPIYIHKDDRQDYSKSPNPQKRSDSLTRTRSLLYRRIHANIRQHGNYPPIFLTLTFAENLGSLKQTNPYLTEFMRKLKRHFGHSMKYIAIPEWQQRGAVHYHIMFFNLPFIHYSNLANIWGHGSIRVEAARKIKNISAYMAKYLSKDIMDKRLQGQRILLTSKGLKKSTVFDNEDIDIFRQCYIIDRTLSIWTTPKTKTSILKVINKNRD